MKKQIYLHIGLPKTGTTWLQREVFPKLSDICYIDCIQPRTDIKELRLNPFYLEIPKQGKTLISDERITSYGYLNLPYISMTDRIKKIHHRYRKASIIIITRNPNILRDSLYKQYSKYGYGHFDYLKWTTYEYDQDLDDIEKYIELLHKLFKNVLTLDYNYLQRYPRSFIEEICDFMSVPVPEGIDYKPVHTSPSNSDIQFIKRINKSRCIPDFIKPALRWTIRGGR